jgi:hypothetical protein
MPSKPLFLLIAAVLAACASGPREPIAQSLADRLEQERRVEEIQAGKVL